MIRHDLTFPKDSFLGQISDESWNILSSTWTTQLYRSGQYLINADGENRDVFMVLRGSAKATIYTPNGREVSFISLAAGDCFGEFSAIDGERRSTSVVASGECYAARLSDQQYRNLMQQYPDMTFTTLTILVRNLRNLSSRVVDFNAKSADTRLREALLELGQKHARGADEVLIERPPTQSELAAYIFTSREGVAREMGRLRKAGLLGRQKRSLHFPSLEKFREFVEEA